MDSWNCEIGSEKFPDISVSKLKNAKGNIFTKWIMYRKSISWFYCEVLLSGVWYDQEHKFLVLKIEFSNQRCIAHFETELRVPKPWLIPWSPFEKLISGVVDVALSSLLLVQWISVSFRTAHGPCDLEMPHVSEAISLNAIFLRCYFWGAILWDAISCVNSKTRAKPRTSIRFSPRLPSSWPRPTIWSLTRSQVICSLGFPTATRTFTNHPAHCDGDHSPVTLDQAALTLVQGWCQSARDDHSM